MCIIELLVKYCVREQRQANIANDCSTIVNATGSAQVRSKRHCKYGEVNMAGNTVL